MSVCLTCGARPPRWLHGGKACPVCLGRPDGRAVLTSAGEATGLTLGPTDGWGSPWASAVAALAAGLGAERSLVGEAIAIAAHDEGPRAAFRSE